MTLKAVQHKVRTIEESLLTCEPQFRYMMLDRLRTDCYTFLNSDPVCCYNSKYHDPKQLWYGDVDKQIGLMKYIYNLLEEKPEWLTLKDICKLERRMKAVVS